MSQDHIKYRDSNVKRYFHKLGGSKGKEKFVSKQEKEEKEFLEAWQKERSTQEAREELSRALETAEKDRTQLETDTKRHEKAQSDLDRLYDSIFDGPTPEVPGEDQLEQSVKQYLEHYGQANKQVGTERQALGVLSTATTSLKKAYNDIQAAYRRSQRDVYLGGGAFTDMMERDALAQSQNNLTTCLRHMDNARRLQPAIRELSDITIDQGHLFSDVLFDNIFSDLAQHDRIKASEAQMRAAGQQLEYQVEEQRGRVRDAEKAVGRAADELEAARQELQRCRAEVFERVGNGGELAGGEAPPPQYSVAPQA